MVFALAHPPSPAQGLFTLEFIVEFLTLKYQSLVRKKPMVTCREEEENTKYGLLREGALGISAFEALRCHLFVVLLGFISLSNSRSFG